MSASHPDRLSQVGDAGLTGARCAGAAWQALPRPARLTLMGTASVLLLLAVVNPLVIVPAGHRGVLTTFGRVEPVVLSEGLHVRVPVAQQVALMNVQIHKGEGAGEAASRDLQHVNVKVAVNYRLDAERVPQTFQRIGTLEAVGERIILPAVHEAVKASVAQFTAEELVTRRADVRERIRGQLDARLRERGVIIEDFAIVSFSFSKEFEAAIEEKSRAEQLRMKAERDLERIRVEAEQRLTRAGAEAQALILQRTAETESLVLQRKAEAESLALQRREITPELLQWEALRRWDGRLPQVLAGEGAALHLPLPAFGSPVAAAAATSDSAQRDAPTQGAQ